MRVGQPPPPSSRKINGGIMSSHNQPGLEINDARRCQPSPVNNLNTGRAINHAPYLTSLPLYNNNNNTTSWEGELNARYGHATHVRIQQEGGRHPRLFMPPQQWWCDLAARIRRLAYHQDWFTNLGLPPDDPVEVNKLQFNIIVDLCLHKLRGDSAYCFGFFVPNSLPSSRSPKHAEAILFSAIAIELVWYGMDHLPADPSLILLNHYLSMAQQCYELAAPSFSTSRSINSNTFANAAITSASRAIKYFERILSQLKLDQIRLQREEAEKRERYRQQAEEIRIANVKAERLTLHKQQLELVKVRARRASEVLHQQLQLRNDAAILIQKRHRGGLVRSFIADCNSKRAVLSDLCRGASIYANNIKATRPPTKMVSSSDTDTPPPPSNNRRSTHPFRDRGLALPKRKRRQRNRRPRARPPRKYRGQYFKLPPSPIVPPPTNTTQDTDATSSTSSTASRCPSASSADEISPQQYHVKSEGMVEYMPLCIWAAQTHAAMIEFDLPQPSPVKVKAAVVIQRWYHHYHHNTANYDLDNEIYRAVAVKSEVLIRRINRLARLQFLEELYRTLLVNCTDTVSFRHMPKLLDRSGLTRHVVHNFIVDYRYNSPRPTLQTDCL